MAEFQRRAVLAKVALVECSGDQRGLRGARRRDPGGRVRGTVASCGYYEGDAAAFGLGAEFHRNAVEIRSVQPGSSGVLENHPRWSYEHLREEAFGHLRDRRISVEGLIDPVVPLAEAADALRVIEANPEESIKLGVVYEARA